jgi:hypothetical protein
VPPKQKTKKKKKEDGQMGIYMGEPQDQEHSMRDVTH